jgi:hypothetical protein
MMFLERALGEGEASMRRRHSFSSNHVVHASLHPIAKSLTTGTMTPSGVV